MPPHPGEIRICIVRREAAPEESGRKEWVVLGGKRRIGYWQSSPVPEPRMIWGAACYSFSNDHLNTVEGGMADRDRKYFNCSEEHELNQVAKKYSDRERVKAFIREKCNDKTIHYWAHEKLASYLAENGF